MADIDPHAVIDTCYAAALDPGLWPSALDGVAGAIDARGTVIVSHDPARTAHTIHSQRLTEVGDAYAAGWWAHDTRIARCQALGIRPGAVLADAFYLTRDEKRGDPFFQDFFGGHGLDDLAAYVDRDPRDGSLMAISAPRDVDKGAFSAGDLMRMRVLAPHAARAFKFGLALGEARQQASDLGSALAHMQAGAILLDRRGCVRSVNAAAERLTGRCLSLRTGTEPAALAAAERERLARLVAVARTDVPAGHAGSVLLRGPDLGRPILIEALPLRVTDPHLVRFGVEGGGALLLVQDLLAPPSRSIEPQLEALGLTRAEARVAMIVGRGTSPREAADTVSVSANTVRSHLKAAYAKLGLRRQSELAILVTRLDGRHRDA